MNFLSFDYQGQTINQRDDGYVNLSQMAKANGKRLNDWYRLESTILYLQELELATGITVGLLLEVNNGMETWGHPRVAIRFAQWLSPKFAVWCDSHIFNVMTKGKSELIEKSEVEKLRLEIQNLKLEKELNSTNIALLQTQELVKENQSIIKKSLEALSTQEEKNFENEYYLQNLAEITIEHQFIKKFFEISMLVKMSGYLFPEINYTIKNLLTIFSLDLSVREIAFYSSNFYRLDKEGKNPHKKGGSTGSYIYSGKELIYPVVAIGILSNLSWENLRDSIEIDYKLRFPQSNRPFLPHN